MTLHDLIRVARERGASDVHLEAGLPAALRVSSDLRIVGEPLPGDALVSMALEVIDADSSPQFIERGSFDLSKLIEGVRCRQQAAILFLRGQPS